MTRTRLVIGAGVSTLSGTVLGVAALILLNASLLCIPLPTDWKNRSGSRNKAPVGAPPDAPSDYTAITERNLFRARLQAEIPKPKSEKEIEEELLTGIVAPMTLKGIMKGLDNKDSFAVIDRGGQKGVWTYEAGEAVERGLVVAEIRKDSVVIEKGDFSAVLRLFARSFERLPRPQQSAARDVARQADAAEAKKAAVSPSAAEVHKEVTKKGATTIISKSVADKLRKESTAILSSLTISPSANSAGKPNGYRIVDMENGSIAQKLGLSADDVLQEINGHPLRTSEDAKRVNEALKHASTVELKVLRRGKVETLRYEIR